MGCASIALLSSTGRIPRDIEVAARGAGVEIVSSDVIYTLLDEVKDMIISKLPLVPTREVLGRAEVGKVFDIGGVGKVAGCNAVHGHILASANFELIRDGDVIKNFSSVTLKRHKDNVDRVEKGTEFAIDLGSGDIEEGDVIECYEMVDKKPQPWG